LTGTNKSYLGTTEIDTGTLSVVSLANAGSNSSIGAATGVNAAIRIASSGNATLKYLGSGSETDRPVTLSSGADGRIATIDQSGTGLLKFTGNFTPESAFTNILNLAGSTAGQGEIAGIISDFSAAKNTRVTKSGTGTWTLSGANTYTGTTSVDAGTLIISGTHTGGAAYTVASGATLGGIGNINTAADAGVSILGSLSPGESIGTLHMNLGTGALDISAVGPGSLIFELGATGDQVQLAGSSVLNIGTLDFADFNFTSQSGFGPGTYTLFDTSTSILGSIGIAGGTIDGLAATLSFANGDQDLVLQVVPEPSAFVLAAIGMLVVGQYRRIRRTRSLITH
jgi:autotransporter-associated beta strand protein